MESTVRVEKLQAADVCNKGAYELSVRPKEAARLLTLVLADAFAALFASLATIFLIPSPTSQYLQIIDLFYVPLALVCCLVAGLHDRDRTNPVSRLRMRVHAVVGSMLTELLLIAWKIPIMDLALCVGVRGFLFFIIGFTSIMRPDSGSHAVPLEALLSNFLIMGASCLIG